jgi:hypothetical protein
MYVATVPNRNSPPAILLRESYRQDGKVKTRTLANITHLASHQIDALRSALAGSAVAPSAPLRIPSASPALFLTAMSPPSSAACAT